MSFELVDPPRLARSVVDRAEPLRSDPARLAEGWPKARVVVVDERDRTPMRLGVSGEWEVLPKAATDIGPTPPEDAVLLGEHDGVAYWTVRRRPSLIDIESSAGGTSIGADDPSQWYDLRVRGGQLDAISAGLVTTAVAVLGWHDVAAFCANCGTATARRHAGWVRHCPSCGREEYPRTDPAVICLVHDGGTGGSARVLLARHPVWPPGRYSVLAGFVEAGESLEGCVLREIEEEVGLVVSDIRYLGSQGWPFPRSLMIGFSAVADASAPLRPADGEIEEAFWVTRDELRASAGPDVGWAARGGPDVDWAAGAGPDVDWAARAGPDVDWAARAGPDGQLLLPPPVSIARSMLDAWLTAG